jgi:hypothetical protein
MDDPKLPGSHRKTQLVLLVVDPYLIHAYWYVAPRKLREMKETKGQTQGVLRFYKGGEASAEAAPGDWFDIDVDLKSRSWYVRLWGPEESLYADLGLKKSDGTFVRLVRSQVVHMPRSRPAAAIEQRFMRVEATERRAEIVPPPAPANEPDRAQLEVAGLPNEFPAPSFNPDRPAQPIVKPTDSPEVVRETLEEVYGSIQSQGGGWFKFETARTVSTPPLEKTVTDLAGIAEETFDAGLSSVGLQESNTEERPDSKK